MINKCPKCGNKSIIETMDTGNDKMVLFCGICGFKPGFVQNVSKVKHGKDITQSITLGLIMTLMLFGFGTLCEFLLSNAYHGSVWAIVLVSLMFFSMFCGLSVAVHKMEE